MKSAWLASRYGSMVPGMRWAALLGAVLLGCADPGEVATPDAQTDEPGVGATEAPGAQLLFRSGFEQGVTINAPRFRSGTVWAQSLSGGDVEGFSWPIDVLGADKEPYFFMMLDVDNASQMNPSEFMENRIETVTGHDGNPTRALYQSLKRGGGIAQNWYYIHATEALNAEELYVTYRMKFPADAFEAMTDPGWRNFQFWKTRGDYRIEPGFRLREGQRLWEVKGDNNANGGDPFQTFWLEKNDKVAIPVGRWFKVELYWKRSTGDDGRWYMAVDGQTVFDHRGPNKREKDIQRLGLFGIYARGRHQPHVQWVDDIEIWTRRPGPQQPRWRLNHVDSEEAVGEDGRGVNAFDKDPNTIWHTQWRQSNPKHPHEIQIDLGASQDLYGFRYLPRQDGNANGGIKSYAFYVSANGEQWGAPVATGEFAKSAAKKTVQFSGRKRGRYIRLVANSEVNGRPWTSVAELEVITEP